MKRREFVKGECSEGCFDLTVTMSEARQSHNKIAALRLQ